ncbi:MAG: hypothetical protein KF778_22245 [Rhodocyclaceae bacterium]|nr:hypothetical protein [Rhodocyclaceae bacterium]MBX3671127.1 hypothetical protein [Rhodocyclaceae bacterium]
MPAACEIEVESPVFGTPRDQHPLPTVRLRFEADRITVRELIALTVEAQVSQLLDENAELPASASLRLARHYLSAQDIDQQAANGKISPPPILPDRDGIDLQSAITSAQQAFEQGVFKIAIDGQLVVSLDEAVPLTPQTPATFIRLTPLTGG